MRAGREREAEEDISMGELFINWPESGFTPPNCSSSTVHDTDDTVENIQNISPISTSEDDTTINNVITCHADIHVEPELSLVKEAVVPRRSERISKNLNFDFGRE
jgi:hypothetical protein